MHYLLAALTFAYLGHPLEPTSASAAEPLPIKQAIELTDKQMDGATAGAAFRFQFNRYGAYALTRSAGVGNVTTATNSNGTLQVQGSGR